MKFLQEIRTLRRTQDPLIEVRISKDAILGNYRAFVSAYTVPIAPVLKSNAYGHGLVEVADVLAPSKPPFMAVDSLYEAQLLRRSGIRTPILVIGYTRADAIARSRLRDIAFTVTSLAGLKALTEREVRASVHIKLDTGMRRQGLLPHESDEAIPLLQKSPLQVEGVCSHFADADGNADAFTRSQIAVWNELVPTWRAAFPQMRHSHLAATAGAAYIKDIDANVVRLGTGIYGFPRHRSQTFSLRPALSMHSVVTGVKDLAAGEIVGYGCTFIAGKPMRIATVPVGYFEGVDRRLSSNGCMLVDNVPCTIVGRVNMNITALDVSDCKNVGLETPVVVFSDDSAAPNSLLKLAELCKTTPLELLVHMPQHLRRTVV